MENNRIKVEVEIGVADCEDEYWFEEFKKENNYCGIVKLVASINDWWTNEVDICDVVKGVLANKSIQDLVNIPKCLD